MAASVEMTARNWEAARRDFEEGVLSRNEISRKHRIRRTALDRRIITHNWTRVGVELSDRQTIVLSLGAALERMAHHLEEVELAGSGEKEAAVLHKLVVSLDKLISIEAKTGGTTPNSRQSRELEALRAKIARRLGELNVE
jgi:hypothetical protein